jgi:hypothetical protein
MERLPKSVDYSTPLATMPDGCVNYLVSNTPINNNSFTPGSTIIVDLNNVPAFLDPASLSFRYKYTVTTPTLAAATGSSTGNIGIVGCPAYTPFLRCDILANSAVVESINNYNSVATMLTNIGLSVSEKLGQQTSLGYSPNAGDTMDNQNDTDGIIIVPGAVNTATAASATYANYVSAPLIGCSLAYAEKLVPLDYVNWRIQLTLDSLANITSNLTTDIALSSYTITNFEIVYNQIQFPATVHQQIKMTNPKIRIKTKSFGVGSQAIASGSNGTINLYYNLRYASIRALFLICAPSSTTYSASKAMESVDPTSSATTSGVSTGGSIQFSCAGVVLPQNPLSTLNNKSGILNELRRAMGSIYDKNNSMSIGGTEFAATGTTSQTIVVPGKFYVGVNCQKLTESQDYMFTGISSANSQINVIINTSIATPSAFTAYLVASYDAIFEIDTLTKQMNYIQ